MGERDSVRIRPELILLLTRRRNAAVWRRSGRKSVINIADFPEITDETITLPVYYLNNI